MIVARAVPQQAEEGDWPARVLTVAERGARAVERTCLVGAVELRPGGEAIDLDGRERAGEVVVLVPGDDGELARRVIGSVRRELEAGLPAFAPCARPQPRGERPGGPLPRRGRGAACGERRAGAGRARAELRGDRAPTACCCRR